MMFLFKKIKNNTLRIGLNISFYSCMFAVVDFIVAMLHPSPIPDLFAIVLAILFVVGCFGVFLTVVGIILSIIKTFIHNKSKKIPTEDGENTTEDTVVRLTDSEKRLLLECEYCGRPICFYDNIAKKIEGYDAKATFLKGQNCCGSCYKELSSTLTEDCSNCKNIVPLSQTFYFNWNKYCSTCWENELNVIYSFYDRYTKKLTTYLYQNNVKTSSFQKIATVNKQIPLEKSDVLYKVSNSQITVIFTCNQRIKITNMLGVLNVKAINEKLSDALIKESIYDILSVQLSGNVIYVLTQLGTVYSFKISATGISVSEEKKIFLPKKELLFISSTADAKAYIESKELIADRYYHIPIIDRTYYDTEQNCFFRVYTSGSYHDGYEVGYHIEKKENILKQISTRFSYYIYASETLYNENLAFVLGLPENDNVKEINPTSYFESAIYGIEYI